MSMVTSCPACTTTFRITPEQLTKREGKVRCGQCSGVFDAFKSLATLPDETLSPEGRSVAAPRPTSIAQSDAAGSERSQSGVGPTQGTADFADKVADAPAASDMQAPTVGRSRRPFVWGCVILVLLMSLVLQLAYAMRDEIAARWPAARPALERMCKPLGCTVSLPRQTEQLAIESSDLQADPQRPNIVVLTAALRNRGDALVAHPSLELTLTNAEDKALARRVFQPADYLSDAAAVERGMAGLAEIDVRIPLDTGDLKPSGYRLFLFYP